MTRTERMSKKRARGLELLENPSPDLIPYNFSVTEFEVQAYLYWELKSLGYLVRGEVTTQCLTCRLDLVVYKRDGDKVVPIRIIEVKKAAFVGNQRKDRRAAQRKRDKQLAQYAVFKVPVDTVCNLKQAKLYIENVKINHLT